MQIRAMKPSSHTPSHDPFWEQSKSRNKKNENQPRRPYSIWLLPSANIQPCPSTKIPLSSDDLHRAFRAELLS